MSKKVLKISVSFKKKIKDWRGYISKKEDIIL